MIRVVFTAGSVVVKRFKTSKIPRKRSPRKPLFAKIPKTCKPIFRPGFPFTNEDKTTSVLITQFKITIMKKTLLAACLILCAGSLTANSLLTSPATGQPFTTGAINAIELIANDEDVALVLANNTTGKLYIIDIEDNDPSEAQDNKVTTIPDFQDLVEGVVGIGPLTVRDIQVNPISKSVYVFVSNTMGSAVVVIRQDGEEVEVLDLSNVTYSEIDFGDSRIVQDMTWGENTLYVSSASFSLGATVGVASAPFEHNATTLNQSTSMFKSNWGGGYFTDAPLEKMAFAQVDGETRLVGVTVCAPGFSLETSNLDGTGVFQVTEDFNLNGNLPEKIVFQQQQENSYMFNLHNDFPHVLMRLGTRFLDGSQVTSGDFNNNAPYLRDFAGDPNPDFNEEEFKIYEEAFTAIAFWDNWNLLVVEEDELKLFKTGTEPPAPVAVGELPEYNGLHIFPNPVNEYININGAAGARAAVYTLDGKLLQEQVLLKEMDTMAMEGLESGSYILKLSESSGRTVATHSFVKL